MIVVQVATHISAQSTHNLTHLFCVNTKTILKAKGPLNSTKLCGPAFFRQIHNVVIASQAIQPIIFSSCGSSSCIQYSYMLQELAMFSPWQTTELITWPLPYLSTPNEIDPLRNPRRRAPRTLGPAKFLANPHHRCTTPRSQLPLYRELRHGKWPGLFAPYLALGFYRSINPSAGTTMIGSNLGNGTVATWFRK